MENIERYQPKHFVSRGQYFSTAEAPKETTLWIVYFAEKELGRWTMDIQTDSPDKRERTIWNGAGLMGKLWHYIWLIHDKTGLLLINWKITDWVWQNSVGWNGEIKSNGW